MIANGAHNVIAHDTPTNAIKIVAAVIDRTMRVENMHAAKRRWLMSHARRRVRPGMARLSINREKRVV